MKHQRWLYSVINIYAILWHGLVAMNSREEKNVSSREQSERKKHNKVVNCEKKNRVVIKVLAKKRDNESRYVVYNIHSIHIACIHIKAWKLVLSMPFEWEREEEKKDWSREYNRSHTHTKKEKSLRSYAFMGFEKVL